MTSSATGRTDLSNPSLQVLGTSPWWTPSATLADGVRVYDERFGIGFTADEAADLVAFLQAL